MHFFNKLDQRIPRPTIKVKFDIWDRSYLLQLYSLKLLGILSKTFLPMTSSSSQSLLKYMFPYGPTLLAISKLKILLILQEIDGTALTLIEREDLVMNLGLRLGPAIKMFEHVKMIQTKMFLSKHL